MVGYAVHCKSRLAKGIFEIKLLPGGRRLLGLLDH